MIGPVPINMTVGFTAVQTKCTSTEPPADRNMGAAAAEEVLQDVRSFRAEGWKKR